MAPLTSPFLSPGNNSYEGQLSILHLRRDHSIPTILSIEASADEKTGYAEGNVVNTRFGSFPHTTLVKQPWGSQVRASVVDTGSRGRPPKKRKRGADDEEEPETGLKEAVQATSGFIHILPPTPENWTTSLPHRTQVVYTPDYSYILHRIKARPGGKLIEAGSGSGSFTHASVRAVFNGYPDHLVTNGESEAELETEKNEKMRPLNYGHVYTYEYHEERHKKVKEEMKEHGLASLVTATHRDVYNDGFLVHTETSDDSPPSRSPEATAIFLDVPAPWQALPHLTRHSTPSSPSPLDPTSTVHICTFSPCIEQAERTVSSLRLHGWIDIEMVEMAQKRIDIRREYTGLEYEGMRGANGVAASVSDAVSKLREVESRAKQWRGTTNDNASAADDSENPPPSKPKPRAPTEAERRESMKLREKNLYKQGRLVHRTEPELKTHTSYLVFAILPREWSREDELKVREKWSHIPDNSANGVQGKGGKSKKQMKREAKQNREGKGVVDGGKVVEEGAEGVEDGEI